MGRFAIAGVLTLALASSALAAAAAKYYVVIDTVGNCAVVDSKPAGHAGMSILGDKGGYAAKDAADKALKALPKGKCTGIVE
jgi:hypothetical protein